MVVVWAANGARRGGRRDPRPHVSGLAQVPWRQGSRDLSWRTHRSRVAGGDRIRRRLARGRGAYPLLLRGGTDGHGCFSDRHGRDWRQRRGFGLCRAVSAGLVQAQRQYRPAFPRLRDENRAEELERMANKPEVRLTDQQRFDWLRLIRSENVGPRTFRALVTNCGGVAAALKARPGTARRGGAKRPIRIASVEEVEKELIAARRLGVRFVAVGEPDYSPALQEIDSAPPILALRGRAATLRKAAVAIVGSRN